MNIETVDDLCNDIADKLGVYGCCKAAEIGEDCENPDPCCCRIGFMLVFPDRIRAAVENEKKLEQVNLKP